MFGFKNKQIQRLLSGILILIILSSTQTVFAHEELSVTPTLTGTAEPQHTAPSNEVEKEVAEKVKQGTYFLLGIKNRLNKSAAEKELLQTNIYKLEDLVAGSKKEVVKLQDQLDNLNTLKQNNERKALAIRVYIAELSNHIVSLEQDLKAQQTEIDKNRREVVSVLQQLYVQASLLYSHSSPEERVMSLLAYNQNLHEVNQKKQYAAYLNEATDQLIAELETKQDAIESTQSNLEQKQIIVSELQTALANEARIINDIREARARLLAETQGKQELYDELLKNAQKEQVNVSLEISKLKDNYAFFEEKLANYKGDPNAFSANDLSNLAEDLKYLRGNTQLAWPVSPSLGISAFFHDAEYHSAMKVGHNAIDIRALQGTKVRAAQDGVVTKVADNGFGYSYIILTHPGKLVTLYGHMSQMDVVEGQIVQQGQVIGLSGGMPGTKGAGWLTTGPHLHFEVFKNFQHVDPLEFLPLEFLPKETLESKYVERVVH